MRHTLMLLTVAVLALGLMPVAAHAQSSEAISLVNQAIVELTDAPGIGARTTVDLNKRWGSDVGQMAKATVLLQDALSRARGSAPDKAVHLLEMAVAHGKAKLHKESRLKAQGALRLMCNAAGNQGEGCDKAPKFGSYVAP